MSTHTSRLAIRLLVAPGALFLISLCLASDYAGAALGDLVGSAAECLIDLDCNDGDPCTGDLCLSNDISSLPLGSSVFPTDVDGDGDIDIVTARFEGSDNGDGDVSWHENDGVGNFVTHVILAKQYISVLATDLDDDGDTDVVAVGLRGVAGTVTWFENDGAENFTAHAILGGVIAVSRVSVADVENDGDTDVIVIRTNFSTAAEIFWFENDGAENFTQHVVATLARRGKDVFAADVDGDNDVDLVSATTDRFRLDEPNIAWHENDGTGQFTTHVINTSAGSVSAVRTADIDGDGDVDVLFADDSKVAWHENNGMEVFATRVIELSGAWKVFAIDIDGDGDTDVLSSGRGGGVDWHENDGTGTFTSRTITSALHNAQDVAAADVDGDTDMDIISADYGQFGSGAIVWHENDSTTGGVLLFGTCSNTPIPGCVCGNGTMEGEEECDDGNALHGDSCSPDCENEIAQSAKQRACIDVLNKAGGKISKAQGRQSVKCLRLAAKAKLEGQTAHACVTGSSRVVSRAMRKAADRRESKCTQGSPSFGFGYTGAVKHEPWINEVGLAIDLLGSNVDLAVVDVTSDRAGSVCQNKVFKRAEKIVGLKLKAFQGCKASQVELGAVQSGAALRDQCLPVVVSDPKVGVHVERLAADVTKKCSGVAQGDAFPGECSVAPDLPVCVGERIDCRVCLMLAKIDAFTADCDAFDDGVANASCPPN